MAVEYLSRLKTSGHARCPQKALHNGEANIIGANGSFDESPEQALADQGQFQTRNSCDSDGNASHHKEAHAISVFVHLP